MPIPVIYKKGNEMKGERRGRKVVREEREWEGRRKEDRKGKQSRKNRRKINIELKEGSQQ